MEIFERSLIATRPKFPGPVKEGPPVTAISPSKPLGQGRYRKNEGVRSHGLGYHLAVSLLTRKYEIQPNGGSRAQSAKVALENDKRARRFP
jgi:hypothetical protein